MAHPCRDPRQTHRFYTEVLGLKLVQAYAAEELMLMYALPEGGSLAFTTWGHGNFQLLGDVACELRHVGITVGTRAEFERCMSRLNEAGIRFQLVEDERIYFSDPDGLVIELEVGLALNPNPSAERVFDGWCEKQNSQH